MKLSLISLTAITLFSASSMSVFGQTGDEIIAKHIEAIGGEKNWNNVKSIKMIGSTSIQGMEVGMNQYIVNGKAMRTEMSVMGIDGYVIVTDKAGWMYMPFQPGMDTLRTMTEEEVLAAKNALNIKHLVLADKSMISKATFIGRDTLDNVPCFKVEVLDKNNDNQTVYFDAKSYYMVRAERTMNVGEEEREIYNSYSDFKKVDGGVVIPYTQSNPVIGSDIVYRTIEVNKPIADDLFKPSTPEKAGK